ncbi:DUF1461 domain-containing protein [Kocuria sp.]|uniref:DUF1461 domain-containing protein n=1 Tax=Kocuria sp. TaxID=1871328 RepID=UPI0026E0E179|nr:DUF1461 domain-containing protein [Kocuria sp.]MDO5617500.1 DUF1461 domain-containing protein [Kocuria sp.]
MSPRRRHSQQPAESNTAPADAHGDSESAVANTRNGSHQDAEGWSRLGAAVTPTGSMDLLRNIPTETGSIRAVAAEPAPDQPAGGPWARGRSGEAPVRDAAQGRQGNDAEPGQPVASTQADPDRDAPAWDRLSSGRTREDVTGAAGQSSVIRILTRILVGVAVPLGLLALAVRLVASPMFLWAEYHRPGFPEDPYGFGPDERMSLGSHGVDYILNWAPSSFLGDVRTANGLAWFRPEEISHMTDVKYVMQFGLGFALVVVLLAAVSVLLRRRQDAAGLIRAAVRGAWVSIAALVVLAVVGALSWEWFFSTFHGLFFADGTWTFSLSDTLIRLYPTRFWVDAAATVALLTVAGCAVVIVWGRRALRRRHLR